MVKFEMFVPSDIMVERDIVVPTDLGAALEVIKFADEYLDNIVVTFCDGSTYTIRQIKEQNDA